MHDYVRNVAVDEQLPGGEADELRRRYTTVRTADPKVVRRLLLSQCMEKPGIVSLYSLRPGPVILKEFSQVAHAVKL
jgi:hypothetical protein